MKEKYSLGPYIDWLVIDWLTIVVVIVVVVVAEKKEFTGFIHPWYTVKESGLLRIIVRDMATRARTEGSTEQYGIIAWCSKAGITPKNLN